MAIIPSFFGTLANSENMQAYIDTSIDNLYGKTIWRNYLDKGIPQPSLTFQQIIGRDRIEAAASITDYDAPAPLRSRPKLENLTGEIPAIKQKFRMNQNDMRALEVMNALNINGNKSALIQRFADDVSKCATAGDKRIDIMLLQGLSTFSIDVSVTNNPDGVAYGTVSLLPQTYQTKFVTTVWSDTANADAITDIQTVIESVWNTYGRMFGKIMMSYELWLTFKNLTKVKSFITSFFNIGKQAASYAITLGTVNEAFASNGWPLIEIVNYAVGVEQDGIIGVKKPFNSNNVVFAPAGKIGTLQNAIIMENQHRVAGKNYAMFDGLTLVGKWAEGDPLVEFTGMEMNAFPAIDVDGIFIMKTDSTS